MLWLALFVVLLGFSYFYRALESANLALWFQQGLLVVALLLSMALVFRFHVYAGRGLHGFEWFLEPFRRLC